MQPRRLVLLKADQQLGQPLCIGTLGEPLGRLRVAASPSLSQMYESSS
jgi:hypothetical protein